jgi:hypothetical protein
MIQTIIPDVPFQSNFRNVSVEILIGALIFPIGFTIGKYAHNLRKNNSEPEEALITFLIQNSYYFLGSLFFLFFMRFWYSLNKIKRIRGIHYNTQTRLITIEYTNLIGRTVRKETIRKKDLRFHLNTHKQEAEISNILTEPFLLNSKTGFSLEKLIELQHLIDNEVNYV